MAPVMAQQWNSTSCPGIRVCLRKNAELIPSFLFKSSAIKWGEERWSRVASTAVHQMLLGGCCPYQGQWICMDFQQQDKSHQPKGINGWCCVRRRKQVYPYLTSGNKCWMGDVTESCHHTQAHLPINMVMTASSWTKVQIWHNNFLSHFNVVMCWALSGGAHN